MAKKYGSIQLIRKDHNVLLLENRIFYVGQTIYADVDGRTGVKAGDGITNYSALPWIVNPFAFYPYPPFKVRVGDPNFFQDVDGVLITDERLLGQTDYVVSSNQNNVEFRADELEFDPDNDAGAGTVKIKNLFLDPTSNVTIYPTWVSVAPAGIEGRLAVVETATLPFTLGGGMIYFNRPIAEIPAGWKEVTNFRGKVVFGYNPADINFDEIGKEGGNYTLTLSTANFPSIPFKYDGVNAAVKYKRGTTGSENLSPTAEQQNGTIFPGQTPTPLDIKPKYRFASTTDCLLYVDVTAGLLVVGFVL